MRVEASAEGTAAVRRTRDRRRRTASRRRSPPRWPGSSAARGADAPAPGSGLSIARGIIDAHGGELGLERGGPGTRFRVRLPVDHGDARSAGREEGGEHLDG